MRKIELYIRYAFWALKRIRQPHLGDTVVYNGVECSLIQGVNNPKWNLLPLTKENLAKPKREIYENVHVNDFNMKHDLKSLLGRFKSDMNFQKSNWMNIDLRGKLFTRHSYISSGKIKF